MDVCWGWEVHYFHGKTLQGSCNSSVEVTMCMGQSAFFWISPNLNRPPQKQHRTTTTTTTKLNIYIWETYVISAVAYSKEVKIHFTIFEVSLNFTETFFFAVSVNLAGLKANSKLQGRKSCLFNWDCMQPQRSIWQGGRKRDLCVCLHTPSLFQAMYNNFPCE